MALGVLALALGVLVYLVDRPPGQAVLIPSIPEVHGRYSFGPLGLWLPSFVHPFAFSLFTAALLPPGGRARYVGCAAWGGVNVAFELGQHPLLAGPLADGVLSVMGQRPVGLALANYFRNGGFDGNDVVAAVLGALAAAAILGWADASGGRTS